MDKTIFNKIRKNVSSGKIDISIDELLEISQNYTHEFINPILLLKARARRLWDGEILGIIPRSERNLENNEIIYTLLNLIDNVDSKITKLDNNINSVILNPILQKINKMKNIFISYSRKDVDFKDELKKDLYTLETAGVAKSWSCDEMEIGKWNEQIQKKLEESDMIIYMLSRNFFTSPYILNDEVQKGLALITKDKSKHILPVIVSDFTSLEALKKANPNPSPLMLSITELSKFQFLPYGKIWNTITKQNEEVIIPLKIYSNKGEIETAFKQITERVLETLK